MARGGFLGGMQKIAKSAFQDTEEHVKKCPEIGETFEESREVFGCGCSSLVTREIRDRLFQNLRTRLILELSQRWEPSREDCEQNLLRWKAGQGFPCLPIRSAQLLRGQRVYCVLAGSMEHPRGKAPELY